MRCVGFIPYWLDYKVDSQGHKNLKKLGGQYLINYSIRLLNRVDAIEQTCIFSSDRKVLDYVDESLNFDFIERPKSLDSDNISIEDIIDAFLEQNDADIIVLLHPNSPFLQKETLSECLDRVRSGEFDSALTAFQFQKLCWFNGKPLNYSLNKPVPKLSAIAPVIFEQSSLYIFTREAYLLNRKRIGNKPYFKFVNHFEGHEVITTEDFSIAELIVNSGMYWEI